MKIDIPRINKSILRKIKLLKILNIDNNSITINSFSINIIADELKSIKYFNLKKDKIINDMNKIFI